MAISGDTVLVGFSGKVYVFVKPAAGWKSMHETAQFTVPNGAAVGFGRAIAVDGNTFVAVDSGPTGYVFLEPTSGWAATSAYQAKLTIPSGNTLTVAAVSGGTVVLGSFSTAPGESERSVAVFQEPEAGWAGTLSPVANLARSIVDPNDYFGYNFAISGDTIAVGVPGATIKNTQWGAIDLFVKPATGWANATETVELIGPPALGVGNSALGSALAMSSSHLITGGADRAYVYSKPLAGWGAFEWPSQEIAGPAGSSFGTAVALYGDTTAVGAPNQKQSQTGVDYVYTLKPNPILVSTDFIQFPDMNFGSSETSSLTVTNSGSDTLTLTTSMDAPNYKVLETEENTCSGGIPAGQSCVLPIEFDARGVGEHTNHLILTSAATAALRIVDLRGYAGGVGPASEGPLKFFTTVGMTEAVPLVLANFGVPGSPTVALSFSGTSRSSYSLGSEGNCAAGVPEGGTCTLMIQFAPTTPGDQGATLTLTPSSGEPSRVRLQGSAGNAN